MRRVALICGLLAISACGGDALSSETAEASRLNTQSRVDAQGAKVDNPSAMMCVNKTATESERRAIAEGGTIGEQAMLAILNRDETRKCMSDNDVVIYL